MTEARPNHLIGENSPYLLQHAYNPVDWHPWSPEVLSGAVQSDKLLVISIGYAACHWCHVMEHESFEDDEVALLMNRDFISVKVDREERPDIDQVYMDAAYATTGRGGWPLNVIALPDQRPVFAGTYFSKRDWIQILNYFSAIYRSQPGDLVQQASEIGQGMNRQHLPSYPADPVTLSSSLLHEIFENWKEDLDMVHGGTYGAPKFPIPTCIDFFLHYGHGYRAGKAFDHALLTLDKMLMGGIYDQLGGGFSRYSVDAAWHVPHFEKMLYDNAQLISVYARAYAATKRDAYKKVVEETVAFAERELQSTDGLFFASIDADSEGVEGKFYAWTREELCKYLGDNPRMFLEYYSCEDNGNWEHLQNILRRSLPDEEFAQKHGISPDELSSCINVYRDQLLTVRENRVRPATDNKVLTSWNALMISALVDASKALGRPKLLEKAVKAAVFYRDHLHARNGKLWRSTRRNSLAISGFLDDYCFLIKSFIDVNQSTLGESWLKAAESLTSNVILHFSAADGLFFRLSSDEEPRLIAETIEYSDNVIPASNSQMARNLFVLGYLLGNDAWLHRSEMMMTKMIPAIKRNPSFHANWASLVADFISSPIEVRIEGDEKSSVLAEFSGHYLPGVIFTANMRSFAGSERESRHAAGRTLIYICHRKTCFSPVETVSEAIRVIENL